MARDAGELVDETTEYGTWADWLGVPRHTFTTMFGAVIARGDDYRQTFPALPTGVRSLDHEQPARGRVDRDQHRPGQAGEGDDRLARAERRQ
jgi:hypothetical protein